MPRFSTAAHMALLTFAGVKSDVLQRLVWSRLRKRIYRRRLRRSHLLELGPAEPLGGPPVAD